MHPLQRATALSPTIKRVALALAGLGVAALLFNFAFAKGDASAPASDVTATGQTEGMDAVAGVSSASRVAEPPQQAGDIDAAKQAAAEFAAAFASYSWQDNATTTAERVKGLVTPELYGELQRNSGATHLYDERRRIHESNEAKVEAVQTSGAESRTASFIVVLIHTTTSDEGTSTHRSTLSVELELIEGRWLVSGIG